MNFKEIQDDIMERTGLDQTVASSLARARIKRLVNSWHRKILSRPGLERLRFASLAFTTTAGQYQYGLPEVVQQIGRIWDPTTSNPRLTRRSLDWVRSDPQGITAQGVPYAYVPVGSKPLYFPLNVAGAGIWAASSHTADTTQDLRMDAIRASGYPHSVGPTTLTGQTRVQLGTRTDYVDVQRIFLTSLTLGDVTFYDASISGNVLGVIPIGKLLPRYYVIQLWQVPSSPITYSVEAQVAITSLVYDADEPMLPEEFHDLLTAAGRYEELLAKKQHETAGVVNREEIQPRLIDLMDYVVNNPDYVIVPGDRRTEAPGSHLGAWFPAGRW